MFGIEIRRGCPFPDHQVPCVARPSPAGINHFAIRRRFCAVAAIRNSSRAPLRPRSLSRSSLRMRLRCANSISAFLRSRRDCWYAGVWAMEGAVPEVGSSSCTTLAGTRRACRQQPVHFPGECRAPLLPLASMTRDTFAAQHYRDCFPRLRNGLANPRCERSTTGIAQGPHSGCTASAFCACENLGSRPA